MSEKLKWCKDCKDMTVHIAKDISHGMHFILTLLTGFWLIIWIAAAVDRKWMCGDCYAKEKKRER